MADRGGARFATWYGLISTMGGVGFLKGMSGMAATLAAFVILIAAGGVGLPAVGAAALAGGVAADGYARRASCDARPEEIVIDKAVGYWTSMLWLDSSYAVVALILFRLVDIVRPFPLAAANLLPRGAGIMAGGIMGGAMVNILMRALSWLFFAGGFDLIYRYLVNGV
ncbi:MAG: phosphatidylglycerophosphatase A [Synergistaceae bacterium]|jgi:phosphatidylglycerophosphatase A|nr:phosphatidylglycerophosphatase A [Synergistaceae bacterium]